MNSSAADKKNWEERRDRLIDHLTQGRNPGLYTEKRGGGGQFLKAVLMPARMDIEPFEVSLSEKERQIGGGHVIVTKTAFPKMAHVDLVVCSRRGEKFDLTGGVEATRPGRRAEDREQGLLFSVFRPARPWTRK